MVFPQGMTRGKRLDRESRAIVEHVVEQAAAKGTVDVAALREQLASKYGIKLSDGGVRRYVKKLSADPPPQSETESDEPDAVLILTPLTNGNTRVYLDVELDAAHAGMMTSRIGEVLAAANAPAAERNDQQE